jgi:tRNA(His) 5'-end guanylyltransferase
LAFNRIFNKKVFQYTIHNNRGAYENTLIKSLTKGAMFDARCFSIPKEEVCNYFIWRQQDATRNSIQMVGQANFSHRELQNKSCNEIQDMLMTQKNINWNDFDTVKKRGSCCAKTGKHTIVDIQTGEQKERLVWEIDKNIPTFTQDRNYIERFV